MFKSSAQIFEIKIFWSTKWSQKRSGLYTIVQLCVAKPILNDFRPSALLFAMRESYTRTQMLAMTLKCVQIVLEFAELVEKTTFTRQFANQKS